MKLIELNKKHYNIPERWDELTEKQLLKVMDVLFLKNYEEAEKLLLKLLQVITGVGTYNFSKWQVEEAEEYLYLLVFLLQPDFAFTKNVIPFFKYDGVKHYGPADALDNLRMKEFVNTEHLFTAWMEGEKKDEQLLNELVAILYREAPAGYDFDFNRNGDKRMSFNENICKYMAKHSVAYWPMNVRLAIATWYDGCRRKIVAVNPDVFEGGSGEAARYGLVSVMLNVAEGGVFGAFEKVEEQYVHLVMMQLNELVDKAKKMEKEMKS